MNVIFDFSQLKHHKSPTKSKQQCAKILQQKVNQFQRQSNTRQFQTKFTHSNNNASQPLINTKKLNFKQNYETVRKEDIYNEHHIHYALIKADTDIDKNFKRLYGVIQKVGQNIYQISQKINRVKQVQERTYKQRQVLCQNNFMTKFAKIQTMYNNLSKQIQFKNSQASRV